MMRGAVLLAGALAALPARAEVDQRVLLTELIGHSRGDVVRRLGPPAEVRTTVDGERLFYQRVDAGRFGSRAGQGARDGGGDSGLSLRDYSFPCRVEIVMRQGVMTAYDRSGAGCR